MKDNLITKILHREASDYAIKNRSYRKLYSDPSIVANLDIVNELDGHSGCVNALSWSKSGGLLASGSDDQHINIYSYQSQHEGKQFQLATTVATGHTQNIFSVKFMPHSRDRIVISAAGDGQVRIFDLEYAGQTTTPSTASSAASAGRRGDRNIVYDGMKELNDGNTDCRVYRSHGDRVKRIVTESSPYHFLTCSEDGEVRQWDLRQPSCAYPPQRGVGRASVDVPAPLISYKRYNLDLNSISCSASQPHYIALGGAHLHAFLHDRRMAGRDRLNESGTPMSASSRMSATQEDQLAEATKCVRKFAPHGQRKMKRTENGHITALKISDARPNEMVASWSGDHIYSFDLVRSPGVEEKTPSASPEQRSKGRVKAERDTKRKRASNESAHSERITSRPRTEGGDSDSDDTALRVRYQNGQQEDIPLPRRQRTQQAATPLTAKQRDAQRIAKATVRIRSTLFKPQYEGHDMPAAFTSALGLSASILSDMDETMRSWGYPVDPLPNDVMYQQTLRKNRESGRRLVQAAGTLARALGGKLQTPSGATSPLVSQFSTIETRSNDLALDQAEHFGYDFLKAILLWLESGVGRLLEGFTRPSDMSPTSKAAARLPIPEADATPEAIDDILIPYLLRLAQDKPITDLEASRFEFDDRRHQFPSEKAAVHAFARAVQFPFADLSSAVAPVETAVGLHAQDRQSAFRYWGKRVARGVLINAAEGVNFTFVDHAFGGLGRVVKEVAEEEAAMEPISDGEDEPIADMEVVRRSQSQVSAPEAGSASSSGIAPTVEDRDLNAEREAMIEVLSRDVVAEMMEHSDSEEDAISPQDMLGGHSDEDGGVNDEDDNDNDDSNAFDDDEESDTRSDSDDDESGGPRPFSNPGLPRFMFRSAFERRRLREKVGTNIPCNPHLRVFRGHCNVKTVKDVNYFGLDDEYVVSGSDDGNFFIWDSKTSQLVNILEGDSEVVNVAQGHPYEPMLAVSGIDHTVKIFSPDARAREVARLGQKVKAVDDTNFSSLAWPPRIRRSRTARHSAAQTDGTGGVTSEPATTNRNEQDDDENEYDDYVAPTGLSSRRRLHQSYQITQQNDVERQGGNEDSFITLPHRDLLQLLFGRLGGNGIPTNDDE